MPTIRVALIDDHHLLRAGMRGLIESRPKLKVVTEVENEEVALPVVEREKPDVIVLDGDDGAALTLVPPLIDLKSKPRLIVLSAGTRSALHREAIRIGAHGIFLKEQSPMLLVKAIRTVHRGETWFSRSLLTRLLTELREPVNPSPEEIAIASLTSRELEVIKLLAQGMKNREIGQSLHISESTVRHHFTSIFNKVGVADRLELLIYANRYQIVNLSR